ncbi:hypothetical protein CH305_19435 [Rhodococcus sp. 15-649-2-2]|mgnify:FL=1|nr:hypothetical protein CH305_19435 [Rhodococcus sp. 15-649-2-2]
MIRFAECEPHEYDESCRVCRDAHSSRFDGPKYAADERRLVLRAMGIRSIRLQNRLLAEGGEALIDLAVRCLTDLPSSVLETQLDATVPVRSTGNAPVTDRTHRMRPIDKRDPRKALPKSTVDVLREFYRAEGRLPVIVPLAIGAEVAAEVGLPTRFLMPRPLRAELVARFKHELTEIF